MAFFTKFYFLKPVKERFVMSDLTLVEGTKNCAIPWKIKTLRITGFS